MFDWFKRVFSENDEGEVVRLPFYLRPYGRSIRVNQEEVAAIAGYYKAPVENAIQTLEKELDDLNTISKRYTDMTLRASKVYHRIGAYLRDTAGGMPVADEERNKELKANYERDDKELRSLDKELKRIEDNTEERSAKLLSLSQRILKIDNKSKIGKYLQERSEDMKEYIERRRELNKTIYRYQ